MSTRITPATGWNRPPARLRTPSTGSFRIQRRPGRWDDAAESSSRPITAGPVRLPLSFVNTTLLRADRVIVLTPKMGGADGISEMTRQWVHVRDRSEEHTSELQPRLHLVC